MTSHTSTHSNSQTVTVFQIDWKGYIVTMTHEDDFPMRVCSEDGHQIGVMHHTAEASGKEVHYCPTGILYCYKCSACGDEPGEPECTRMGE